jgi:hypothetical protein
MAQDEPLGDGLREGSFVLMGPMVPHVIAADLGPEQVPRVGDLRVLERLGPGHPVGATVLAEPVLAAV